MADPHPEFEAEARHLRTALDKLEERIDEVGRMEAHGPSAHDSLSLFYQLRQIYENLLLARRQVYFGRLDFAAGPAGEVESHYIGRIGFDRAGVLEVVDWRAPLARLFSRRRPGPAEYHSPDGKVSGQLHLKRHFAIETESLRSLHDEFDTRPTAGPAATRPGLIDPDAFLREILSGRGDARMGDIVASLQEHQDDLIRAGHRQVLVIQGVAGSGKTSIALHRVAFLLYPGSQTGIDAQRCIIFGPNPLFLDYIANVLPGLGVREIPQTTLDAWAMERLGLEGYALVDSTLDALLSNRMPESRKKNLARGSQLKASLRMGTLLENLAAWWRARLQFPEQGLAYPGLGPLKVTASLARARALELSRPLAQLPLAQHRRRLQELLLGELMGAYTTAVLDRLDGMAAEGERLQKRSIQVGAEAERLAEYARFVSAHGAAELEEGRVADRLEQGAAGARALADYFGRQGERSLLRAARLRDEVDGGEHQPQIREQLARALEADLEAWWPELDPLRGYAELLDDADLLTLLGKGIFEPGELALIEAGQLPKGKAVDASDLPALCCLHTLVYGVPAPLYDHVVVDEAQDAAPLYYAVLRRLSRGGSFTILGDAAQSVYAYRGITGWDDVRRAFDGLPYSYAEVTDSYRSTVEIIDFANRILELLAPADTAPLLARPFERRGAPVALRRLPDPEALGPAVAEAAAGLRAEGYENIAVIAKTFDHCAALADALRAHGLHDFTLASPESAAYKGGVFVLPVHLAKGLEFEAVLVAGAEEANFASTEFDGRLLYVACTRALHALQVFGGEPLNAYLELASSG